MAIRMMTSEEKAKEIGLDHPSIEVVHNYPGAESGWTIHHLECPNCPAEDREKAIRKGYNHNYEKHRPGETPLQGDCHDRCRETGPLYMHTTYEGCVLSTFERNGYDDSDFYAVVWDEATQKVEHVQYASTRGWTYPNGAGVDATDEVKAKANAYLAKGAKAAWDAKNAEQAKTPEKGKRVRVVRGRKVPRGTVGVVFWYGQGRNFGGSRYSATPMRVGFKDDDGETIWTAASNVEVIDPQQYLKSDSEWHFQPPYGEGNGASYRVGIQVGNTAIALN